MFQSSFRNPTWISAGALVRAIVVTATLASAASAQDFAAPRVPPEIQAPAGHVAYLKVHAMGTQNYVCLPSASGMAWKFQGPQATLFYVLKWFQHDVYQQVGTHFLSPNPVESGTARAAWQSSLDTSSVWAKKIAESVDPAYVQEGAVPWFLLQIVGTQNGPSGGSSLSRTSYIQRVNTTGGVTPAGSCSEAGALQFVPYTADYVFYRAKESK